MQRLIETVRFYNPVKIGKSPSLTHLTTSKHIRMTWDDTHTCLTIIDSRDGSMTFVPLANIPYFSCVNKLFKTSRDEEEEEVVGDKRKKDTSDDQKQEASSTSPTGDSKKKKSSKEGLENS